MKHHIEVSSEMLASTVQFSKNNRANQNRTTETVMRLQVPQSEVTRQSPFPQDPTACPAPHPPDTAVPTPPGRSQEAVLAGSHEW